MCVLRQISKSETKENTPHSILSNVLTKGSCFGMLPGECFFSGIVDHAGGY